MAIEWLNIVFNRSGPRGPVLRLVLIALADQANSDGICWPSVGTIARRCAIAERTVQSALRRLEREGWIKVDLGGRDFRANSNRSSVYHLVRSPGEMGARHAPLTVHGVHPDPAAHAPTRVQETTDKGAARAPEPSSNHQMEPSSNRGGGKEVVFPNDQSEPIRYRMHCIGSLKKRDEKAPWSAKEFAAFNAARIPELEEEAFGRAYDLLLDYYSAPLHALSEHWGAKAKQDFRRRDVLRILENWTEELDHAQSFSDWKKSGNARLAGFDPNIPHAHTGGVEGAN